MTRQRLSSRGFVLITLILCGSAQVQGRPGVSESSLKPWKQTSPPVTSLGLAEVKATAACAVGDAKCFCNAAGWGGNYAEPSCKGYYGCVDKNDGHYFPCQAGTLYDASCRCCNWQSQVQCSNVPPASSPSPQPSSPPPSASCFSWRAFQQGSRWTAVRLNTAGNAECISRTGASCVWGTASKANKLAKSPPAGIGAKACSTGVAYKNSHWCVRAKAAPCTDGDSNPPDNSACTYLVSPNDVFWGLAQTQMAAVIWEESGYQAAAPPKSTWLLDAVTVPLAAYNPDVQIGDLQIGMALDVPCKYEPPTTPITPGSSLVGSYITQAAWNDIFKHTGDSLCTPGFYSYSALIQAAATFPAFASTGDDTRDKRELAAFLAQISHETTGGWPTAPDGQYAWGLCFKEEGQNTGGPGSNYCMQLWDNSWPCTPGKSYHGRGPIQLSYNFNYGPCGKALGLDLLNQPELVSSDATIAFRTALWFWMTPQDPKPSCHDVMQGRWTPSANDVARGRVPGFGVVTNIINGGIECGHANNPAVADRIGYYKRYAALLGVDVGDNLDCATQAPFTW